MRFSLKFYLIKQGDKKDEYRIFERFRWQRLAKIFVNIYEYNRSVPQIFQQIIPQYLVPQSGTSSCICSQAI